MAHPYHHSLSSVRTWGGAVSDYQPIHDWFDESKKITADFRHRALRHHAEGIFMAETIFGHTLTLSSGRVIPTRWVGEQHVREDLGFIPSFADWVKAIRPEPWMGRAQKLEAALELRSERPVGIAWQSESALLRDKPFPTGGMNPPGKPQGMGEST
jgi:hypothetical protein